MLLWRNYSIFHIRYTYILIKILTEIRAKLIIITYVSNDYLSRNSTKNARGLLNIRI